MIRFDVLSIFPEMFLSPLQCSLLSKARQNGFIEVIVHNLREYTYDKHRMTDDEPYGGGGGMVMKVEPVDRALQAIAPSRDGVRVILMTPQGVVLRQDRVRELSRYQRIIFVCGHYEGVDERIRLNLVDEEVSIGDYVLTGGELAALVMIDAVSRFIPGVLGNDQSAQRDSFSDDLLEHSQYTRPSVYRGWEVPEILRTGHHRRIEDWRRRDALRRTAQRRPDLLKRAVLSDEDRATLTSLEMGSSDNSGDNP